MVQLFKVALLNRFWIKAFVCEDTSLKLVMSAVTMLSFDVCFGITVTSSVVIIATSEPVAL